MDGFTEAHFVGEQGAFAESEVEHALPLIGIKRAESDVFGVAAFDDTGLVVATEDAAFFRVFRRG